MVLYYNFIVLDRSKLEKVQGLISTVRDFGYFFVNLIEYYYNICLYYITLILQKFIINISKNTILIEALLIEDLPDCSEPSDVELSDEENISEEKLSLNYQFWIKTLRLH